MKTVFKNFFFVLITFLFLSGCQNVRDTLSMKKKKSFDEFLIEKKNPLIMPPEFSELPKPKETEEKSVIKENIDLSEVIGNSQKEKISEKPSNKLEKSISEILKKK